MKREEITVDDIIEWDKILNSIPRSEMPRIYYNLNRHNWPEELGEIPEGYGDISKPIPWKERYFMDMFDVMCGRKAVLRYAHIKDYGVTDQQFEDWWDSNNTVSRKEELCDYIKRQTNKSCNESTTDSKYPFVPALIGFLLGGLFGKLLLLLLKVAGVL